MICIISVRKNGKLYKEFSTKYFFIHHKEKYIEFQNSDVSKYMWFKDIEISNENGVCIISVDM